MAGKNSRIPLRATAGFVADEVFTAAIDFSSCPFRWVMPGSIAGEVTLATGASLGAPLGVLQGAPAAGKPAVVRMFGKSIVATCVGACDLKFGTYVTAASSGVATPSVCGLAFGRWAGSANVLSTACVTYGDIYVNTMGIGTCVPGAS